MVRFAAMMRQEVSNPCVEVLLWEERFEKVVTRLP